MLQRSVGQCVVIEQTLLQAEEAADQVRSQVVHEFIGGGLGAVRGVGHGGGAKVELATKDRWKNIKLLSVRTGGAEA